MKIIFSKSFNWGSHEFRKGDLGIVTNLFYSRLTNEYHFTTKSAFTFNADAVQLHPDEIPYPGDIVIVNTLTYRKKHVVVHGVDDMFLYYHIIRPTITFVDDSIYPAKICVVPWGGWIHKNLDAEYE